MLVHAVAADGLFVRLSGEEFSGFSDEEVHEHAHLLEDAGLAKCSFTVKGPPNIKRLTWAGHEFLDALRSKDVWDETKRIAEKAGGWSFDILKKIAEAYLKQQIKDRTGLDI